MGLLNFLFGSGTTRTVSFTLPEAQSKALDVLFQAAVEKDPEFTEEKFYSYLITDWLEKNWGGTVTKMANIGKKKTSSRKRA